MKRRIATWLVWAVALFGLGLVVVLGPSWTGDGGKHPLSVGDTAPDFSLEDLEGQSVRLSELRGKVVLLNFWATWCPPCIQEIPSLESLGRKLAGKPFAIVAASSDSSPRPVERVVRQYGVTFLVLLDPFKKTAHSYGTFMYPETFLIGADGRILGKYIGPQMWDSAQSIGSIERAIAALPATAAGSAGQEGPAPAAEPS